MDWRKEAISELKQYTARCATVNDNTLLRLSAITERGLESVGKRYAAILTETYINNTPTKTLCKKFNLNKYQLGVFQNEALYYFTIALYGVCEI